MFKEKEVKSNTRIYAGAMYSSRLSNPLVIIPLAVVIYFVTSLPEVSSASVRTQQNFKESYVSGNGPGHIIKRDTDKVSQLQFNDRMDEETMAKLGNTMLENLSRNKRDQRNTGEAEEHILKAEADSIAAAAESSAAETHAIGAAVETAEAEDELEHGAVGGATFEENDAGEMVHVLNSENHSSGTHSSHWEKEHGRGQGHGHGDSESESRYELSPPLSVFDTQGGHGGSSKSNSKDFFSEMNEIGSESEAESESHSSSNSRASSLNGLHAGDLEDVNTPLNKLLDQSTDLAKETRLVFQVIAKREDYLVTEMESFKKALQNAIEILHETARENKARYKRWDNTNMEPYKACVYVSPPQEVFQAPQLSQHYIQENPQPVQALPPSTYEEPPAPDTFQQSNAAAMTQYQPPSGEDIDLSSVYWLKLPQGDVESSLEKVQRVLGEVRQSGRDVLLIPVLKGFTDANDMANGFLRAVRVSPAYANANLQSSANKKRRRRLRLRIRRVL